MRSLQEETVIQVLKGKTFESVMKFIKSSASVESCIGSMLGTRNQAINFLLSLDLDDDLDLYLAIGTRYDLNNATEWLNHFYKIASGECSEMGFEMPRIVILPYDQNTSGCGLPEPEDENDLVLYVNAAEPYECKKFPFVNPGVQLLPAGSVRDCKDKKITSIPGSLPLKEHCFGTLVKMTLCTIRSKKERSEENDCDNDGAFVDYMKMQGETDPEHIANFERNVRKHLDRKTGDTRKLNVTFFSSQGIETLEDLKVHEKEVLGGVIDIMRRFELRKRLKLDPNDSGWTFPMRYEFDKWGIIGNHEGGDINENVHSWKDCELDIIEKLPEASDQRSVVCDYPNVMHEDCGSQRIIILLDDKKTYVGCDFSCTRVWIN